MLACPHEDPIAHLCLTANAQCATAAASVENTSRCRDAGGDVSKSTPSLAERTKASPMSESPRFPAGQSPSSPPLHAPMSDTDDNESAHRLHFVVSDEDDAFVARCLEVEVASDGSTEPAAVSNLREALELYFEDRIAQLVELPCRTYRLGQVVIRPTHP